jgi:hypothetical protein
MQTMLSLTAWSAWAPDKPEPAAWQAWAEAGAAAVAAASGETGPAKNPDISAIPAMQRRRLSSLSRMAFATAAACSGAQADEVCCIFASRHGELTRTLDILDNIVAGKDVSPTDFSHSVHSTALGLFSIFMKNKAASTQVVAGEDTFGAALLETALYLARFPQRPVLLVFCDEPVPAPLADSTSASDTSFSIALLFSAAAKPNLRIEFSHNVSAQADALDPGLDFLKFHLSGAAASTVSTSRTTWRWSRL